MRVTSGLPSTFSMKPSTSAVSRSGWVGILRAASAPASVPVIQPPTAATRWSSWSAPPAPAPRAPQRALVLDDPDLRDVNQLSHTCPPRSSALRDDALEGRVLLGVGASHEHVPGPEHPRLRWVEDMARRPPRAPGKPDHAGPFLQRQLCPR